MQRWFSRGVIGASILLLAASCGGNSEGGGGSCGKVQPCGGNPTGVWEITTSCIDARALGDDVLRQLSAATGCDALRVEETHAEQTGSVSFNADMSYESTGSVSFDATVSVPASCITQGGFTLTCGQLNQLIKQLMMAELGEVTCKEATGGCSCKLVTPPRAVDESGTYSVSGTKLTTSGSDAPSDFCVQGNELHVISVDATKTDSSGRPVIVTDVVGTKR